MINRGSDLIIERLNESRHTIPKYVYLLFDRGSIDVEEVKYKVKWYNLGNKNKVNLFVITLKKKYSLIDKKSGMDLQSEPNKYLILGNFWWVIGKNRKRIRINDCQIKSGNDLIDIESITSLREYIDTQKSIMIYSQDSPNDAEADDAMDALFGNKITL